MIGRAAALARDMRTEDHDVVRIHCVCGQPIHLGLTAGPTFDQHRDRRGKQRSCRLILLPDPHSRSVSIQRLLPSDSAEIWLKKHRAGWLKGRNG